MQYLKFLLLAIKFFSKDIGMVIDIEQEKVKAFILPTGNVSTGALRVNKLSIQNINGIRKLLKENQPVVTVSLNEALQDFQAFLSQVKRSSQKESCIVLIGHNSSTFDANTSPEKRQTFSQQTKQPECLFWRQSNPCQTSFER